MPAMYVKIITIHKFSIALFPAERVQRAWIPPLGSIKIALIDTYDWRTTGEKREEKMKSPPPVNLSPFPTFSFPRKWIRVMYHRNKEMTMKPPAPPPSVKVWRRGGGCCWVYLLFWHFCFWVGVGGSVSFFDTFVWHKMEWVSFCVNHADPVVRRYIL